MCQSRPALFRGRHFQGEIIVFCVRWYLRNPLSYRDLQEMMGEQWITRPLPAGFCTTDQSCRTASGARCANPGGRGGLMKRISVLATMTYLYRAVDSRGHTIDFLLSPNRNRAAAKGFLRLALSGHLRPRVINVDGHPAYPAVIDELKQSGELSRRCRCRPSPYMNNIIEQDHRFVKKRVVASQWFRSVDGALNTIDTRP
jgi:IS6 family transposase